MIAKRIKLFTQHFLFLSVLILLLSACSNLLADMKVNYDHQDRLISKLPYINNKLNGIGEVYYPSGALKIRAQFSNDQFNGFQEHYHQNGQLMAKIHYKNNNYDGDYMIYDQWGNLLEKRQYKDNQRDGLQSYYNSDGILIKETHYKQGKKIGDDTYWNRSSLDLNAAEVSKFKANFYKENHFLIDEYGDGFYLGANKQERLESIFLVIDKQFITYQHYKPNGQLNIEAEMANSQLEGLSKQYNNDGGIELEAQMSQGKANGVKRTYYPDGQLKSEQMYLDQTPINSPIFYPKS